MTIAHKNNSLITRTSSIDKKRREGSEDIDIFHALAFVNVDLIISKFITWDEMKPSLNHLSKLHIETGLNSLKLILNNICKLIDAAILLDDVYHTRISQGGARTSTVSVTGKQRKQIRKEEVKCKHCAWISRLKKFKEKIIISDFLY